jgi:hypothetical protein
MKVGREEDFHTWGRTLATHSSQLKKVKHRRHAGFKRLLDRIQLLPVFNHHTDEIFGVPEGLQNRFGLRFPVRIGRFA